ncbi:unnamed protein product [Ostreobium quekettii]|uniref:Uncharacterized protein n=1 Tax=Ostreobium quekettii TaxID=121088 RepID=A0A8S1IVJ8_9CHLO|nr:unnamed protein product [Ostreobium quekettii]
MHMISINPTSKTRSESKICFQTADFLDSPVLHLFRLVSNQISRRVLATLQLSGPNISAFGPLFTIHCLLSLQRHWRCNATTTNCRSSTAVCQKSCITCVRNSVPNVGTGLCRAGRNLEPHFAFLQYKSPPMFEANVIPL